MTSLISDGMNSANLTGRHGGPRAVKLQFKNYKPVAVEEQKLDHIS